jgi:hypothetical protein
MDATQTGTATAAHTAENRKKGLKPKLNRGGPEYCRMDWAVVATGEITF